MPALFTLQSKLIAAFVLVALATLVLAGSVFVFVRRGDQEEQALDHVIATSPTIYSEFIFLQLRGEEERALTEFVHTAAAEHDVRILLVDSRARVVEDSEGALIGEQLALPSGFRAPLTQFGAFRSYTSWRPEDGSPASDLILLSALPDRLRQFGSFLPGGAEPYSLVLAVPENTIARAWLGLLPGLAFAAAIALPVAIVLAIFVARYITGPLQQLTVASQRMAAGSFDVEISVDRGDEVGQLARAFSTMAHRVGEATSEMRALIANVSHDLKTPLTSILGFAQALRDGGGENDVEVRRMGSVIYDEASRLTVRLNDLLYLSELQSGQMVMQRDVINLRTLIETALQRIEAAVAERELRVTTELADVTLSADGPKLERAVENLIDNACKYAPPGSEIRVGVYLDAGSARIEVTNTAQVAQDELPRLFERFYRRDQTRGSSIGSGLGLPIARDLIEAHGGTLEASVSDGKIVFTARLPLAN